MKNFKKGIAVVLTAIIAALMLPLPAMANTVSRTIYITPDTVYDFDTDETSIYVSNVCDDASHNHEKSSGRIADPTMSEENKVLGLIKTKDPSSGNDDALPQILPAIDKTYVNGKIAELCFDIYLETNDEFFIKINNTGWTNGQNMLVLSGGKLYSMGQSIGSYTTNKWYSMRFRVNTLTHETEVAMKDKSDEYYNVLGYTTFDSTYNIVDNNIGFFARNTGANGYVYLDNMKWSIVERYRKSIHYDFNDVKTKNGLYFKYGQNCNNVIWSQDTFDGASVLKGTMNVTEETHPNTFDSLPDMEQVVVQARMGFDGKYAEGGDAMTVENLPFSFGIRPTFETADGEKNSNQLTGGIIFDNTRSINVDGKGVSKSAGVDTIYGYNLADGKLYDSGYVYDCENKLFKAYFITNNGETIVNDISANTYVQAQRHLAGIQLYLRGKDPYYTGKGYWDYLYIEEPKAFCADKVTLNDGQLAGSKICSIRMDYNYVIDPEKISEIQVVDELGEEIAVSVRTYNGKTLLITPEYAIDTADGNSLMVKNVYDLMGRRAENISITGEELFSNIKSDIYQFNVAEHILMVMPYTNVSSLIEGITITDGMTAQVRNTDLSPVGSDTELSDGMLLCAISGDGRIEETYTISILEKLISENFENSDIAKYYYGNSDGDKNWGFSFPNETKDKLYMEIANMPVYGHTLHTYSYDEPTDSTSKRMNCIYKGDIPKDALGKKIVMRVSVLCPTEKDSICQMISYMGKDKAERNLVSALSFDRGELKLFGTYAAPYKPGVWNEAVVFMDTESGNAEIYLNGNLVYSNPNAHVLAIDYVTQVRAAHHVPIAGNTVEAYIDNFELFGVGSFSQTLMNQIDISLSSERFSVENKDINGYIGMTAGNVKENAVLADGATMEILDASGNIVSDSVFVEKGMKALISTANGAISTEYTFQIEHYTLGDTKVSLNGIEGYDKFSNGIVSAGFEVHNYSSKKVPVAMIAAQYSNSGRLMNISIAQTQIEKGVDTIQTNIRIDSATDTFIKIFSWDSLKNMKNLKPEIKMEAFDLKKLENVQILYPGYVEKAITFSYDDLNDNDVTLINILKNHEIKGTFNLVTNKFSSLSDSEKEEIRLRYADYESASHSYSHPHMWITEPQVISGRMEYPLTYDEVVENIRRAQQDIKDLNGEEPIGYVWPYQKPDKRSDFKQIMNYIQNETSIKYVRPTTVTHNFDLPQNWYNWEPTCHHDELEYYLNQFDEIKKDGKLKILYVWGHAYELREDTSPEQVNKLRWSGMEQLCERIEKDSSIWKATNGEIYTYAQATENAIINYTENKIVNHSNTVLYAIVNGIKVLIPANGEYNLEQ